MFFAQAVKPSTQSTIQATRGYRYFKYIYEDLPKPQLKSNTLIEITNPLRNLLITLSIEILRSFRGLKTLEETPCNDLQPLLAQQLNPPLHQPSSERTLHAHAARGRLHPLPKRPP